VGDIPESLYIVEFLGKSESIPRFIDS